MFISFNKPLSGRPLTLESKDHHGQPIFKIKPEALTPFRCKAADALIQLTGFVLVIACALDIFNLLEIFVEPVLKVMAMALIAYVLLAWLFKTILKQTTSINMTTEAISIRRWYGWVRYHRHLEHQFALLNHDKMRDEQQRHEYEIRQASAKGKVLRKKAYYADSFHIVLVYAGHRRELLTVYGQKEAVAIVTRLQYCDRRLNEAISMGAGSRQTPEEEWNSAAGGFHHE
jgi:hypothetical protein